MQPQHFVKQKTCYKNPEKLSCIDLILENHKQNTFQNTSVLKTGLSYFHKMTITVMKLHFPKRKLKIVCYRDYKNFLMRYLGLNLIFNYGNMII